MRDGGSARPFACGEQPEGLPRSGGHRRLKASRLPVRAARREGRQAGGCRARIGAAPDGGVRHLRRQEPARPRQCHHAGVRSEDARHAALLHDARVVPLHLREIIERACAFEPSARYQTVVQLGAAVDAVRRGVREPSDANSFSAAGDGARGSRSDGWRGGGASGSSQQARHFASSGPTDSANAQAPGGSPFRQAASSQGQTSGHDATCGPGLPLLAPPTRRGARERRRVLSPVSRGWSVFWASCSACSSLRSFLLWDGATAGGEAKTIRPLPTWICTRSSTLNRVSLIRKQSRTTLA